MEETIRRAAAIFAIVVGISLVVEPFALNFFNRGDAGERITNRFRQTMTDDGLNALQANFKAIGAYQTELTGKAFPYFAQRLGMTPAQFDAYVKQNFPAVAKGSKEIPPVAAFVAPVIPQIVADQDAFEAVDSLPFLGLPLNSVAWLMLGLGVLLIVLGAFALRSKGSAALAALAVLGLGMLAVPLHFSIPSKANDGIKLRDLGKVALSQKAADAAAAANADINGTVTQTGQKMLPALAARLGISEAAMNRLVAQRFPGVSAGIKGWPSIRPGSYHLATIQAASVADNETVSGTPLKVFPWLVIVPGALMLLLAGLALREESSGGAKPAADEKPTADAKPAETTAGPAGAAAEEPSPPPEPPAPS